MQHSPVLLFSIIPNKKSGKLETPRVTEFLENLERMNGEYGKFEQKHGDEIVSYIFMPKSQICAFISKIQLKIASSFTEFL